METIIKIRTSTLHNHSLFHSLSHSTCAVIVKDEIGDFKYINFAFDIFTFDRKRPVEGA